MGPIDSEKPSFLFTDLVGSTELWEEHPEAMQGALGRHDAILRRAVADHGGQVFATAGDAFSIAFESSLDALLAAVDAQKALMAEDWPETGPLAARMALHRGEAARRDDGYYGQALNRCARLLDTAHGRQILLSSAARAAIEGGLPEGFGLADLGLHRLRDLREPERVYQLLHPDLPAEFPPLRSLDALPNNLPMQLTNFVGRGREIAAVQQLLAENRLVTLTGTGGCGKTRLALQVAAELTDGLADGAWLVELGGISDPDLVPQAVAGALGVREPSRARPRQNGASHARERGREAWLARLIGFLGAREVLLVLDNCEHLVATCAWLSEALLQACPRLRILATSREALAVTGEASFRVPSLSVPESGTSVDPEALLRYEAVRLFVNRAQKVQPGFRLTEANAGDVAKICRRLDGIPLAIELSAVKVKLLTPEQIAKRLDDRFRLLTGGSRTAVPRQQTLRATMDWSHELLGEPERTLLRRLAVFNKGFSLDAAELVCGDLDADEGMLAGESILDLLTQLVDKSLVVFDEAAGRYRMLQTMMQYGLEKLMQAAEAGAYRRRHRDYFLGLARGSAESLRGPDQVAGMAGIQADHGNLRAALAWSLDEGDAAASLGMVTSLWFFWFVRGFLAEGRDWLEQALALPAGPDRASDRAQALLGSGALLWRLREYAASEQRLDESLAAHRALADLPGAARSLHFLGRVAQFQGEYELAALRFKASLELSREAGDPRGEANTLDIMGLAAWQQGDYAQAVAHLERSLAMARELGDLRGVAASLNILGRVAHDRGDYSAATELYEDSLQVFRALGDELDIAYIYNKLGNVARHEGDLERAEALLEQSRRRCQELGERRGVAYAENGLGNVARERGDLDLAESRFKKALLLSREIGDKRGIADALRNLGWLAEEREQPTQAFVLHSEALERYASMGDKLGIAEGLAGVAGSILERMPVRAARLYAASQALREAIGAPLPPVQKAVIEREFDRLRVLLGESGAAEAAGEGSRMSVDEAMHQARELLARPAF